MLAKFSMILFFARECIVLPMDPFMKGITYGTKEMALEHLYIRMVQSTKVRYHLYVPLKYCDDNYHVHQTSLSNRNPFIG